MVEECVELTLDECFRAIVWVHRRHCAKKPNLEILNRNVQLGPLARVLILFVLTRVGRISGSPYPRGFRGG